MAKKPKIIVISFPPALAYAISIYNAKAKNPVTDDR